MMRRTFEAILLAIAVCCTLGVHAVPAVQTIPGTPLKILIGDDTSYQVLNSSIGGSGQIYPGNCTTSVADAGIFTSIGGVLYAPDFQQHFCASATGGIGPSVAWTPVSMSGVTGNGTPLSPYAVNVVVNAGTSGVTMSATYTYVDGDPFFRITKVFTATNPAALNVYTGADIFLANSDAGIPYLEPTSTSPGGKDCGSVPTYTILLIPTTPADHYTALGFSSVWSEIGTQGNLSDTVGGSCIDNGAALQWQRTLNAGTSVTITSAVSFGPIPSIVQFNVTSVSPPQGYQGQTLTVVLNGIGFQNNTTFDFGPGITVTSTTIDSATQATLTIVIAPGATVGPRNVTGTQSPGGLTATLINGFTVLAREECARMRDPRVLCTTDGSGDYLITFTFENLSTQTIRHLFLTGLSGGATATPNYINLSTPVPPGGTAAIGPIRIHGASPGVLSMTVSLHDGELEECCSFEVRFELPRCDCAQIVESSGPRCRPVGNGYTYTFAYQNLFNGPVQQLLITPELPTTATYSPNVIPLNPPMVYGETRTFTITINNAPGAQPVCFRITSKSDRCDHCCSIRRCVFLPRCIGDVVVIGDTEIVTDAGGLTIVSDSNEPGCTFPLAPDTTEVDLAWLPLPEALPAGSFVEQRYRGSVDGEEGVLATTRTAINAGDTELHTSFDAIGATSYRYEFLSAGRFVGAQDGVPNDAPPICMGCGGTLTTRDSHFSYYPDDLYIPPLGELQSICERPGLQPCYYAAYTFDRPYLFNFEDYATKFEANEVRVWPENGVGGDIRLSAVDFQARGPHSVTFTELAATVDCNGNGVDDFTDIATGASLDVDRNGVPDECQSRGADLDLSLNTGFDETHATTLAGGSDDDDWRVVNAGLTGPAKVMRNPHAVWAAPFPQSAWISVTGDRGDSIFGVTTLQFENCFCIGSGATTATLDLQVRADDNATVYLNGAKISDTGGTFSGTPLAVHLAGRVGGDGPFRSGRNCIRIDVTDFGIVTGLDATGTIRAPHGSCDTGAP